MQFARVPVALCAAPLPESLNLETTATSPNADAAPVDAACNEVETLLACAKLLALGIASHRARFGAVPLANHAEVVPELRRAPGSYPLDAAAQAALAEAFELLAAAPASAATAATGEQRRQPRISLNAPVKLSEPGSRWLLAGTLLNVSWGGALVRCKGLLSEVGESVCVHLAGVDGGAIAILATIVRVEGEVPDCLYALRFESVDLEDERRLQEVLASLMQSPLEQGRRAEPRLVQRLDLEYGDAGEFRATLEDISANGLMLTVPDELAVDQSLLITLSCPESPRELCLRARVVHRTRVGDAGFPLYRVGLRFEHPDQVVRRCVSEILVQLVSRRPNPP
jgi:c-di-GMP-binding flagellar brake protein YcgR